MMVWSLYFPFRKDLFWGISTSPNRGGSESVGCPRSVSPTCFHNGVPGRWRRRKGKEAGGVLNTFPWIAWFEGHDAEGKDPRKLGSGFGGIERCLIQGLVFVKYIICGWKLKMLRLRLRYLLEMVCCPVSDFEMAWFAECIPLHWN